MSIIRVNTIQDAGGGNASTSTEIRKGRAKAYVNFNGAFDTSTDFTLANNGLRSAYNVTSVTDRGGNGKYTVNFASDTFTSVNYIAAGIAGNYGGNLGTTNNFSIVPDGDSNISNRTVTAFAIKVVYSGSGQNKEDVSLVFFGD